MISHKWSPMKRLIWLRGSGITGGSGSWDTITGNPVTFSAKRSAPLKSLKVALSYDANGITGTEIWIEDEYDPTADPTLSVTFPTTIYGGEYDAISGVLTSTYAADGTELANPVTYQLSGNAIYTLDGENVIWSSADTVTVVVGYVDKKEYPIVGYGQADYMIL